MKFNVTQVRLEAEAFFHCLLLVNRLTAIQLKNLHSDKDSKLYLDKVTEKQHKRQIKIRGY
jgi:hypothetical protein